MTRKKAIEAALERWNEFRKEALAVDAADVIAGAAVDKAYDLGRIAGMRELISKLPSEGALRAWDTKRKLRSYVNALAKKARRPCA